jgi:hypothetical protein
VRNQGSTEAGERAGVDIPEAPGIPKWHTFCFCAGQGGADMYSILYIIGAIVVIIVVLRVLGLY